VFQLLVEELKHGRRHSKKSLEDADAGSLKRNQIRSAVAWLEATGRIEMRKRPDAGQHGAREYLHPLASPNTNGEAGTKTTENTDTASPSENTILASPPLRDLKRRRGQPPVSNPVSLASPESDGEATARRRGEQSDVVLVEVDL
jgi:hypothetical protein